MGVWCFLTSDALVYKYYDYLSVCVCVCLCVANTREGGSKWQRNFAKYVNIYCCDLQQKGCRIANILIYASVFCFWLNQEYVSLQTTNRYLSIICCVYKKITLLFLFLIVQATLALLYIIELYGLADFPCLVYIKMQNGIQTRSVYLLYIKQRKV